LLHVFKTQPRFSSVLAWPAWLRIAVLLPLLALLWLAVGWATSEVVPL
jgi:hypothetical protein